MQLWGWGNERGGEGGGEGGGERLLIKVFNKTGIVTLSLVIGMHIMRRNQPKIAIWQGIPVMTSRSQKYVIISWKKSGNEICERFHAWDGAMKKKVPS